MTLRKFDQDSRGFRAQAYREAGLPQPLGLSSIAEGAELVRAEPATRKHLPGLDGLRGIAVALVVAFHQDLIGFGWVGVQLFFVLSGYLITNLLHQERNQPLGTFLRNFYGRRLLRICPLYFGVLLVLTVALLAGAQINGVREGLPYAYTYTYNIWHATNGFVHSRHISHFWSLCVEEQFYLLWPFLIYFCPARRLRSTLFGVLLAGPLIRLVLAWLLTRTAASVDVKPFRALYVLMPTHIDAFATGAIAALYPLKVRPRSFYLAVAALLIAGMAVVYFGASPVTDSAPSLKNLGYPLGLASGHGYLWGYTLINFTSVLLIDCLVRQRLAPSFFDSRPLRYLGKISYGLYVFHYPVLSVLKKVVPRAPLLTQVLLEAGLTLLLATLSYYLWEKRFLVKKDRWFPA
ncbi:MAG TPA: acyltransferase [Polyangiaceae bacterium]